MKGTTMDFISELKWRGLIKDVSDMDALIERLKTPIVLYCGFDPTADSLHIGHLQQLLLLKRFLNQGHHPIALIGGATGMIGDPRPTSERALVTLEEIQHNIKGISTQIHQVLASDQRVKVVNNYDWLSKIDILTFLRDIGKHFNVNVMIAKDIVATRLETGISFTEFTYTILQALDWYTLLKNHQCEMQIGGSDQWGNLISGVELIRKMSDKPTKVFAMTSPLITKSDGSKFGKSEGQNIWLDPQKTNPYAFYQFWINVSDQDVIELMKRLSFESIEFIESMQKETIENPHLRSAQKALAKEMTQLVFGDDALAMALKISDVLFSSAFDQLSLEQWEIAFADAPKVALKQEVFLVDALLMAELVKSKREARELITNGSVSVNGIKVDNLEAIIYAKDAYHQRYTIIKKGKKSFAIFDFHQG